MKTALWLVKVANVFLAVGLALLAGFNCGQHKYGSMVVDLLAVAVNVWCYGVNSRTSDRLAAL